MKEWFATLIDDLKFLGREVKREFSDVEITPASEVRNNGDRDFSPYIPINVRIPQTNMQFYRRQ